MTERIRNIRGERGFTLIELLIVIIILGILAAIVIFGVTAFRGQAVAEACNTDLKQVKTAAAAYLAKNGMEAALGTDLAPDFLETYPDADEYDINYVDGTADDGEYTVTADPACATFE